jgi:acyl-CoA reductase-like NAD-dependent aldehyde dehydrogenase
VLRGIADTVEEHGEELAMLDTLDTGTPLRWLRGDIALAVSELRYYAGLALQLRGETVPTGHEALNFTLRDPFGVVGRIVPFNHPLMFAAARLAAPLLAGNTVVLKPSEATSLSALRLGELVRDVVPAGVLNVVTGDGGVVGDHLVRHPDVPRIAFTGGVDVGRQVQRSAAEAAVKTVTLELGGKNPLVVFPDADVDEAVAGAMRGMNFTFQGQSCGSTSRLFVHASLFEEVVGRVSTAMDALVVGDPRSTTTDVGAVTTPGQFEKVQRYLRVTAESGDAVRRAGRQPLTGAAAGPGLFVRPTLFTVPMDTDLPVAREEIFGAVLVAFPFDTYDEVIAACNALPLGLTASVYTRDLATALRAARDLECGYVWVNGSSSHIPGTAFGGTKNSGVGREEGIEELYGYTQPKNVHIRFPGGQIA